MEPPSPSLMTALGELRLAGGRDVRRAARHCRRLSRDLPAFDSVWIDALVRLGRLTLFQAAELQGGRADRLRVGEYVLRDRLAEGSGTGTYIARSLHDGSGCVLKVLGSASESQPAVAERLRSLVEATRSRLSPATVAPHDIFADRGRLILVSRLVKTGNARTWLIRRGRFSPADVLDIARRLLASLGELHRLGISHGDVHAGNLLWSARRGAVLVDAGVRPALSPILRIDESCSPHWYEGTAPERIGTGSPATIASDVYACGCLLWHLLAGRPPFPAGDALTLLTSHRSRALPSIADFAPATPSELVDLIADMTQLDPETRPVEPAELQRRLRPSPSRVGFRSARAFSHESHSRRERGFPWPLASAALLTLGGIGFLLADREPVAALLSIRNQIDAAVTTADETQNDDAGQLLPLPEPDEQGCVVLDRPGPYAVGDIVARGPLVLRGRADRPATIVVVDRPLHLLADECTLEHLHIVSRPVAEVTGGPAALALVETQNLTIRNCRLDGVPRTATDLRAAPAGVAWRLIDRQDPTAGRIRLENCIARGVRQPLYLADPAREIVLSNVLAVGVRSLLSFQKTGALPATVTIERTTLREALAVVDPGNMSPGGELRIVARDSILDLKEDGSLFAGLAGSNLNRIRWEGSGVVTTGDVRATAETAENDRGNAADSASVVGVSRATVDFAGPAHGSDAASVATVRGVPRRTGQVLGIDLSQLPPEPAGAVTAARR